MNDSKPELTLVAHRGWPTRFPENSLASFAAAIECGADEVELDVWASKDGVPFVCHDPTLDRTTSLSGRGDTFDMTEIAQADVRAPNGDLLPGMSLPTLRNALDLCTRRVAVNIHVKNAGPDACILRLLHEYFGGHRPPCGSYIAADRSVLEQAIRICPEIPRCCLEAQHSGDLMLENAIDLTCERLQFGREKFTEETVQRALDNGIITNLFWSDSAEEILALYDIGILAPLTNDIGTVKQKLAHQG
jgi:glycerophosphoryl diester phosphodiesterase